MLPRIHRARSRRTPRSRTIALGASLLLLASGCSSTAPAPTVVSTAAAAPAREEPPPPPDPRLVASEHFHQGKAFALAGDAACARLEFQAALEAFRAAMRPGDSSDLAFAGHLWESVRLYETIPADEAEEPAAGPGGRDGLIADDAVPATADEIAVARRELEDSASGSFDVPIEVNDAVLNAVAYYQFRTPKAFAAALQRSGRYLPLMRSILRESGLPEDLVYLAMIESAFKSQARSRAAAKGYWQFISATGKRYGLKVTRDFDERSDPVKSTRAAAAYLRDLYEMFGDWYLAMAAYNAGEGKVLRGLQRTGARNYWELREGNALRRETKDYVPYFLAAALISRDPVRFGFDVIPDAPLEFDVVELPRPVEIARVARELGIAVETIQALNGELRGRTTPRGVSSYPLRVPRGAGPVLSARLDRLPAARATRDKRVAVRKGESLSRFARRNKVSVADLCAANDIRHDARLRKGQLLVVPSPLPAPRASGAALAEAADVPAFPEPIRGEVRALPTPSAAVADAASLGPDVSLAPAPAAPAPLPARVEIPAEGFETTAGTAKAASARPTPPSRRKSTHTVRKGETLYRIASRYGVTVEDLRRENRIGRSSTLRVGQRLSVPEPSR